MGEGGGGVPGAAVKERSAVDGWWTKHSEGRRKTPIIALKRLRTLMGYSVKLKRFSI